MAVETETSMTRLKRLSSKTHSKNSRKFWFPFAFVFLALIVGGGSAVYFFLKQRPEITQPIPKNLSENDSLLSAPKAHKEEDGEDILLDGLFEDSEIIQLYKAKNASKGKNISYWTWALEACAAKGLRLAIIVTDTEFLEEKDLEVLKKLGIPFGFVVSPKNQFQHLLMPLQEKGMISFFLEVPSNIEKKDFLEFADSVDWLRSHLEGVIGYGEESSVSHPNVFEAFLNDLRSHSLLFINASKNCVEFFNRLSEKTLALSLTRDWTLDLKNFRAMTLFQREFQKKKCGVLFASLKDLVSAKGQKWIKSQRKQKVNFVSVGQLFCRTI